MVCMAIYKKLNEIQPMMIFGTQFCTLYVFTKLSTTGCQFEISADNWSYNKQLAI